MRTSRHTVRRAAVGAAPYPGCIDPVDGVTVCTLGAKVGPPRSIGQVSIDTDRTLTLPGVLVTLEECVDGSCRVVATATGSGTALRTQTVDRVPGATYRTTASWSDSLGRQHHGVVAQ